MRLVFDNEGLLLEQPEFTSDVEFAAVESALQGGLVVDRTLHLRVSAA